VTAGVAALPMQDQVQIMQRVQSFSAFTPDNDPWGEHDFGSFEYDGKTIFWKIDYYDRDLTSYSTNRAEESVTTRVLKHDRPRLSRLHVTSRIGGYATSGMRCDGTNRPVDWLLPAAQDRTGGQMWLVKAWMDAVKFNLEVQSVVAMRLMKIAAGGATGAAESTRMVQEKAEASAAAVTAGALALAKGR
jgi:Protein of unknown function (DUF3768)